MNLSSLKVQQNLITQRYAETKWVWPIQLLFNNIGWYLAYEERVMGDKPGLLKTERIDRISQRGLILH